MTMHLVPGSAGPLTQDALITNITPERRMTLLAALRSARHFGVDSEEEGFLLDHLIDALAEDEERGGNSLCAADLIDEYLGDLHPIQRETPYWVEARDAVERLCRGNLAG